MTFAHLRHRFLAPVFGLHLLFGVAGCDPAMDTRTALITQTLVDADRDLVATRPTLVAEKYQVMAQGLQPYLRGTALLFYRDLSRYQDSQASILHGTGAEQVQLYGDVHLENVGVTFDVSGALLDVIDFDATARGPFGWEVRRSALALRVALSLGGVTDSLLDAVVAQFGQSYATFINEQNQRQPPAVVTVREQSETAGKIITDLLADGRKRNEQREELSQYTQVKDGVRLLLRNDDLVDMDEPWRSDLEQMLAQYRTSRHAGRGEDSNFRILDAVRKLHSGVASLPNLRFWVMVQGSPFPDTTEPDAGVWLLEFKEERDPPIPIGWLGRGPIGSNGERVYSGTLALLGSATSEADLGYVTWGGVSFQVRRVLRGRRDLDVAKLSERIASARYGNADLSNLATTLGRLVASGHARSGQASAIAAVLTASDGTGDAFVANLVQAVAIDQQRLERDLALFQSALAIRGPLLGARSN